MNQSGLRVIAVRHAEADVAVEETELVIGCVAKFVCVLFHKCLSALNCLSELFVAFKGKSHNWAEYTQSVPYLYEASRKAAPALVLAGKEPKQLEGEWGARKLLLIWRLALL